MAVFTYPGCTACCGDIRNSCCPDDSIPAVLFATIIGRSGCECLSGTYMLIYNAGTQQWTGIASVVACATITLTLYCVTGSWFLDITGCQTVTAFNSNGHNCPHPFEVDFSDPDNTIPLGDCPCGGGGGTMNVVITE